MSNKIQVKNRTFRKLENIYTENCLYIKYKSLTHKIRDMRLLETIPMKDYIPRYFIRRCNDLEKYKEVIVIRIKYSGLKNYKIFHILIDENNNVIQWPRQYRHIQLEYDYLFKECVSDDWFLLKYRNTKYKLIESTIKEWYKRSKKDDNPVIINLTANSLSEAVYTLDTPFIKSLASSLFIDLED